MNNFFIFGEIFLRVGSLMLLIYLIFSAYLFIIATQNREISDDDKIRLKTLAALNIEEDLENLRYNQIVVATDADVDGMHIRLLLLTFFLQYFPDLIRQGHLHILQTPLYRVRSKKETIYCYSSEERDKAIRKLGNNPEITRFKGLGEISPDEFKYFIGENIRLEKVRLGNDDNIPELLEFYMGKNTPDRQNFIRANLRPEVVMEDAV